MSVLHADATFAADAGGKVAAPTSPVLGATSVFDNDGVSSDDRWLVSSPWPAAPRERERQLPYLSPAAAHTLLPIEDARDQIALDRGVFCEERNEGLDVVPGRGGFQIADYLLYRGDLLVRHGVLHCADRTSAAASATTAKPMRSTRATITLSHRACNARASVGTECARAWRVSSAFTGAATRW